MLAGKILEGINFLKSDAALLNMEAADISADSRNTPSGSLFFAYGGSSFDSHAAAEALYNEGRIIGAVCEREIGVPCVIVENGRRAFSLACANFFGNPQRALTTVGVTGTNGKTTVTWLLESIFTSAGMGCVRIGTTGASVAGKHHGLDNTTPSPREFYSILADGVKAGAKAAVAEVSSHALDQDRLYGMVFDVAVFTNLSGDHLDYHKELEAYYNAKKKLFTDVYSRKRVINISNAHGKRLYDEVGADVVSFGVDEGDLHVKHYKFTVDGTEAVFVHAGNDYRLLSPLVGRFNLENMLASVAAAVVAGIAPEKAVQAAGTVKNVPGRLERYSGRGVTVFVDYAHTDDALENVLTTIRQIAKGRLITVFGAGGDRDMAKRPRMGRVVQKYSDLAVVTSDNPRTENPDRIIKDIMAGMTSGGSLHVEPDRRKAIEYAIGAAGDGDAVLVAGKGHEDYQIIGKNKRPFSDSAIVREFLGENG